MVFRFQKRVKISPGLRFNLSKSGVSINAGVRGASVTVGKKGVRQNVGIPGTGLSWSKQTGWSQSQKTSAHDEIHGLIQACRKHARDFNKLPDSFNSLVDGWNKALERYNGGRGGSESKFETLTKKLNTTLEKSRGISESVNEMEGFSSAVLQRLSTQKFGFFERSAKKERDDFLPQITTGRSVMRDFQRQMDRILKEIEDEHSAAAPT